MQTLSHPAGTSEFGRCRSIVVAIDDRVGYRALGDHANYVTGSRPRGAAEDNGGAGTMASQSGKHEAQQIAVPADHRPAFDEAFDKQILELLQRRLKAQLRT